MVKYEYVVSEIEEYKFPTDGKFSLSGSHLKEVSHVRLEARIYRKEYDNNGLVREHAVSGIAVPRKELTQGECEVLFTAFNHEKDSVAVYDRCNQMNNYRGAFL